MLKVLYIKPGESEWSLDSTVLSHDEAMVAMQRLMEAGIKPRFIQFVQIEEEGN